MHGLIVAGLIVIAAAANFAAAESSDEDTPWCKAAREAVITATREESGKLRRQIDSHLAKGKDINDINVGLLGQEGGGESFLHIASITGDVRNVRYLIAKGANVNTKDRNGGTALVGAVVACDAQIVAILIQHGADPYARDQTIGSPIEIAREYKLRSILRILLKK